MNNPNELADYRPVPDFDGYLIDRAGRVLSNRANRKKAAVGNPIWREVSPFLQPNGQSYRVALRREGKGSSKAIALLVMEVWGEPRPTEDHRIHFADGNRLNHHIDNLEWRAPTVHQRQARVAYANRQGIIRALRDEIAKKDENLASRHAELEGYRARRYLVVLTDDQEGITEDVFNTGDVDALRAKIPGWLENGFDIIIEDQSTGEKVYDSEGTN